MTIYYTGRGDKGKSEMGVRKIAKNDPVFDLLGDLDELNSWLGFCNASEKRKAKSEKLKSIQEDLFIAQAEVALQAMGQKSQIKITEAKTKKLEAEIAKIDKVVPPIKKFIIPGGSELATKLDYARALARRAERSLVKVSEANEAISLPELLQYLNRLSSYLFALARLANFELKLKEYNPSYK